MSSLSEELLKLSEMFASGILSEEEFKSAKEVTIKRFTAQSPLQSLTTTATNSCGAGMGVCGELAESEAEASFSRVDISGFADDIGGQPQREKAYGILETILRNVYEFPAEQKYRRLRPSNSLLQSQLFSVPGVMEFLKSVGFALVEKGGGEDAWLQLCEDSERSLIYEALEAVHHLRCRDRDACSRARDYVRLRRNFALEVRRERCEKAKAVGELCSYIVQEFCQDDAGDCLYSSLSSLERLRTILTNVLRFPAEAKYRRLRLTNRAVHAAVLRQRGGLELMLECAGGEVVEEPLGGDAFLLLREGVATEDKLRCAVDVLEEAQSAVQIARENMNREAHEKAREAVRIEVRRAREEMRHVSSQPGVVEQESENSYVGGQRRRIPVAKAVQILLGKKGCEEDEKE